MLFQQSLTGEHVLSTLTALKPLKTLSTYFQHQLEDLFLVGHVMRSVSFSSIWQIGHEPTAGVYQLERRHSLRILYAQGVITGSSAGSMHIGHQVFSPFRIPSTTSSVSALVGAFWLGMTELGGVTELGRVSRNFLASLFKSEYCCESARHITSKRWLQHCLKQSNNSRMGAWLSRNLPRAK